MWVEFKTARTGKWIAVGRIFPYPYHKDGEPTGLFLDSGYEEAWNPVLTEHPYSDRDYTVFGVLAGVRSYDVEPIAEPKGLPDDLSSFVAKAAEEIDHTPSWLSLDEIEAYDWSQTVHAYAREMPLSELNFFTETLPRLRVIRAWRDVTDVRIVFGFDS